MFMKKFLGLVPLRTGSIVLAYAGIAISVAIIIWFWTVAHETSIMYGEGILTGEYGMEYDPGEERLNKEEEKLIFTILYLYRLTMVICYLFVYTMLIIFSVFLAIGAHHHKRGLLNAYFVYGFVHCVFCLVVASLHYHFTEYVEAGFIVASDVVLLFCLCGVKGLMDSISNNAGRVYSRHENGTNVLVEQQQTKPNLSADNFNGNAYYTKSSAPAM